MQTTFAALVAQVAIRGKNTFPILIMSISSKLVNHLILVNLYPMYDIISIKFTKEFNDVYLHTLPPYPEIIKCDNVVPH